MLADAGVVGFSGVAGLTAGEDKAFSVGAAGGFPDSMPGFAAVVGVSGPDAGGVSVGTGCIVVFGVGGVGVDLVTFTL